jgi:hypothetical protein
VEIRKIKIRKKKQKEKGKREFLKVGSDFGNSLSVFIRA